MEPLSSLSLEEQYQHIFALLDEIVPPGIDKGISSLRFVMSGSIDPSGAVTVGLELRAPHIRNREWIEEQIKEKLAGIEGVTSVRIETVEAKPPEQKKPQQLDTTLLREVKRIVAVSSGKGGVGKSTVAANLAAALALEGHTVGVLDADIYGPSMSVMFGVVDDPEVHDDRTISPAKGVGGIAVVSMAMFSDPNEATIWRGPMASQMIQNFLFHVRWGELDYLVIDMPPGTGDIQLSLTQSAPITGAVVVTTPQEISVIDARKGLRMFEKVGVPVLGVVENMSGFICDSCNKEHKIFGEGGGRRVAETHGVPFLGGVPLELSVGRGGDAGRPAVLAVPNSISARRLTEMARTVHEQLSLDGTTGLGAYQFEAAELEVLDPAGHATFEPRASRYPVPVRIGKSAAGELIFEWSDGKRTVADYRSLRLRCPCAHCVEEWTGKPLIDPAQISSDVTPLRLDAVGRYAVRIVWSDGHDTGIYSYDYLRRLEG